MVTLGYYEDDIKDLSIWDIVHPDHVLRCKEIFQQVLSGKILQNERSYITCKRWKARYAGRQYQLLFPKQQA